MRHFSLLLFVTFLLNLPLLAQLTSPPTSFSTTIPGTDQGDVDIVLYKYSMRDSNLQVFVYDGDSTITPHPLPHIRTYRGYISSGKYKGMPLVGCWYQDDLLYVRAHAGKGDEQDFEFNEIDINTLTIDTLNLPLVTNGKAKYDMTAGINTVWRTVRDRCDGDLDMTITMFEFGANQFDFVMARDIGLSIHLNLIVLPKDTTVVDAPVKNYWTIKKATYPGINTPKAWWHLWGAGGGAGGKHYCSNWRGGVASMYRDGSSAWTHEFGHTMGLSHYNNQMDYMDGNGYFAGRESSMRIHSRIERTSINCISGHTPTYTDPVRPYTPEDYAIAEYNTPLLIDVLANDIDYNGDIITIKDVDSVSEHGGTLKQVGQKIEYTPPTNFKGRDVFFYRAQSGDSTSVYNSYLTNYAKVIVDTREEELAVYYSFEEENGFQIFNQVDPNSVQTRAEIEGGTMETFSAQGKVGKCIQYQATTDKLKMSDALDPLDKSWSISMWFNMDEIPEGDTTKSYTGALIYDSGSHNRETHTGVAIDIKPNGLELNAQHEAEGAFGALISQRVTWQTNRWYHVAMIIDRDANKIKGYLDGVPFSSNLSEENIAPAACYKGYPSPRGLYKAQTVIGGTSSTEIGGVKKYFLGKIDEVKIYTKKLSEAEVLAEYNNPGASGIVNNCPEGLFTLEPIRNGSIEKDIISPAKDRESITHDWYYYPSYFKGRAWTNHLSGSDAPQAPDGKNWLYLNSYQGAVYQPIGTWKENLSIDLNFVYSKFIGDETPAGLEVSIWAGGGPGEIQKHLSDLGGTKLDSIIIYTSELDSNIMVDKSITLNTGQGDFECGEPLWVMFSTYEGGRSRRCLVDKINIVTPEPVNTVGINEKVAALNNVSIYPNPTSNLLTVKTDLNIKSITVYNAIGQNMLGTNKTTFSTSSLEVGVYILNIATEDNTIITRKFIKK